MVNQIIGLILIGTSLLIFYVTLNNREYLRYLNKIKYLSSWSVRVKFIIILLILLFMSIYGLLMIFGVIDYTHPLYPEMQFK